MRKVVTLVRRFWYPRHIYTPTIPCNCYSTVTDDFLALARYIRTVRRRSRAYGFSTRRQT